MSNIYQNGIDNASAIYTISVLSDKCRYGNGYFMDIRQRLEQIREEKNITREELAAKLGVSTTTIFRKERGKGKSARQIKTKELQQFAEALGCTIDYILNSTAPPEKISDGFAGTSPIPEREIGMLACIETMFRVMIAKKYAKPEEFAGLLNHQLSLFRMQNQPGAAEVTQVLIQSLNLEPHGSKNRAKSKSLSPARAGSH